MNEIMSKKEEYLLVGSAPDLVQSFMQSNQIEPVFALDETTYLVIADEKPRGARLHMLANLYTKEDVRAKDMIAGIQDDKVGLAVRQWAGQHKP